MAIPHPDYPTIDFKPAIARYDWDQTYDVLEFAQLPRGFNDIWYKYKIPCVWNGAFVIDRFTPYRYLWAEQYSDYVYNFLKQFNYSPHHSISQRFAMTEVNDLTGKDYHIMDYHRHPRWKGVLDPDADPSPYVIGDVGFDPRDYLYKVLTSTGWAVGTHMESREHPEFKAFDTVNHYSYITGMEHTFIALTDTAKNYSPLITTGDLGTPSFAESPHPEWVEVSIYLPPFDHPNFYDFNNPYDVTLPEGDYTLTWLAKDDSGGGTIANVTCFSQTFHRFTLTETTTVSLQKIIGNWSKGEPCANSLVLSELINGTWQQVTVTTPYNYLFYSDIADYFSELTDALVAYFTTVPNYVWGSPILLPPQSYPNNFVPQVDLSSIKRNNYYSPEEVDWEQQFTWDVETFPDHFRNFCYLQRANNNKWGTGTQYNDLGWDYKPSWYPLATLVAFARYYYMEYHGLHTRTYNNWFMPLGQYSVNHSPSPTPNMPRLSSDSAMDWTSSYWLSDGYNDSSYGLQINSIALWLGYGFGKTLYPYFPPNFLNSVVCGVTIGIVEVKGFYLGNSSTYPYQQIWKRYLTRKRPTFTFMDGRNEVFPMTAELLPISGEYLYGTPILDYDVHAVPEDYKITFTLLTEAEFNEALLAPTATVPETAYLTYLLTIKAQQEAQ